jgi:competence protein ComEC
MSAIYPDSESSAGQFRLASSLASKPNKSKTSKKKISDNARSLCLVIEFAQKRVLLPGDLESPGTQDLTARPRLHVDVLMAPHHGSLTTKQDGLIEWCQPSTIVISGSHRSLDPRVFQVYSPSGQKVLHTARDHAVQLCIEPNGSMLWNRWLDNQWRAIED